MSNPASVRECRWLLRNMGFDRERCNERSALVLLALLGLKPGDPWAESEARSLRTVDSHGMDPRPMGRGLPAEHSGDDQATNSASVRAGTSSD